MGVDVTAISGIGVYVNQSDIEKLLGIEFEEESEMLDAMYDYKSDLIELTYYGNSFTGNFGYVILCKNLLKDSLANVSNRLQNFKLDLVSLGITSEVKEIKEILYW